MWVPPAVPRKVKVSLWKGIGLGCRRDHVQPLLPASDLESLVVQQDLCPGEGHGGCLSVSPSIDGETEVRADKGLRTLGAAGVHRPPQRTFD